MKNPLEQMNEWIYNVSMKKIYLLCNAHIDPVWQWDLAEGKSVAVSTFASVADLLEQYDFVFCHNESVLYQWVEEYEPALFKRIQRLVKEGKWRIMGGWYIQPDCNMPAAESIIRQALVGKAYFKEKFGEQDISAAVNLDSFGHSGGLPKLLNALGYDSYVCTRPMECFVSLGADFVWEGMGGGRLKVAHPHSYNSLLGEARQKIEAEIERTGGEDVLVLWGVGNHGGGPSRKDLQDIADLVEARKDISFKHIWPENYFEQTEGKELKSVKGDLYPCFPGCYTSQIEIKQAHRRLENLFYETEKLAAYAAVCGMSEYPAEELSKIQEILLFSEFHDILPGTSIKRVMNESLGNMGEGISRLNSLQAKLLYKLACRDKKAEELEYPVFVFNPCPYPVTAYIENPILLAERFMEGFADLEVRGESGKVVSQVIKEDSNIPIEWAKKVAFEAQLKPFAVTRFDIRCVHRPQKPVIKQPAGDFIFENNGRKIVIGAESGLIESYMMNNAELVSDSAFCPVLYDDNEDPWAMQQYQQERLAVREKPFKLANKEQATRISGFQKSVALPVRITEDGALYTAVEAIFVADTSYVITEYKIYKTSPKVTVKMELHFDHKNKMVKVEVPSNGLYQPKTQILGGCESVPADGSERICHKWVALSDGKTALAVLNDCIYGFSAENCTLNLSLVRGAGYTAHFISPDREILKEDRYHSRIDQGEHTYCFELLGGTCEEVFANLDREALNLNERPFFQNIFPLGGEVQTKCNVRLEGDNSVVLSALKKSQSGYVARLSNGSEKETSCKFTFGDDSLHVCFAPFEIKTIIYDGNKLNISDQIIL